MYTIFDTGSSDIMVSEIYFKSLIEQIFAKVGGKEWSHENGKVNTMCYTNFPDIFFAVSGRWIQLSASDYVLDTSF